MEQEFEPLQSVKNLPAPDCFRNIELKDEINKLLAEALTETEEIVIRMRMGLNGGEGEESLRTVAQFLATSPERVKRIQNTALRKMICYAGEKFEELRLYRWQRAER